MSFKPSPAGTGNSTTSQPEEAKLCFTLRRASSKDWSEMMKARFSGLPLEGLASFSTTPLRPTLHKNLPEERRGIPWMNFGVTFLKLKFPPG